MRVRDPTALWRQPEAVSDGSSLWSFDPGAIAHRQPDVVSPGRVSAARLDAREDKRANRGEGHDYQATKNDVALTHGVQRIFNGGA